MDRYGSTPGAGMRTGPVHSGPPTRVSVHRSTPWSSGAYAVSLPSLPRTSHPVVGGTGVSTAAEASPQGAGSTA